ncbi:MAG: electron transport protein SCO1/SenC [Myxococcales bacterium]|nr:electron transport protein SCO1/SenC [Myxococcales bacterium]
MATGIPGRRLLVGLVVVLLFAVVPGVVVPTLICRQSDPELPDLGEVSAFSLTDETGQPFTEQALRGHATIVSFVFTRCDLICPVTSMRMENIQEKTFDAAGRVKLLSFTVDPDYDTPERLTAYAKRYHANPTQWRFVTGPVDKVRSVIEGPFMTSMLREADRPGGIPNIAHAGYFLLLDPQLHIRGKYETEDVKRLDEMIHDARFLARTMN